MMFKDYFRYDLGRICGVESKYRGVCNGSDPLPLLVGSNVRGTIPVQLSPETPTCLFGGTRRECQDFIIQNIALWNYIRDGASIQVSVLADDEMFPYSASPTKKLNAVLDAGCNFYYEVNNSGELIKQLAAELMDLNHRIDVVFESGDNSMYNAKRVNNTAVAELPIRILILAGMDDFYNECQPACSNLIHRIVSMLRSVGVYVIFVSTCVDKQLPIVRTIAASTILGRVLDREYVAIFGEVLTRKYDGMFWYKTETVDKDSCTVYLPLVEVQYD